MSSFPKGLKPGHFESVCGAPHLRLDAMESLRRAADLPARLWFASRAPLASLQAEAAFLRHLVPGGEPDLLPGHLREAAAWTLEAFTGFDREPASLRFLHLSRVRRGSGPGGQILEAVALFPLWRDRGSRGRIHLDEVRGRMAGIRQGLPGPECGEECRRLHSDHALPLTEEGFRDLAPRLEELLRWLESMPGDSGEGPEREEALRRNLCYLALLPRIEEFFRLSRLSRLHPGFRSSFQESEVSPEEAGRLPLAPANTEEVLRLSGPVHPQDEARLEEFRERILDPALGEGRRSLKRPEWNGLRERFARVEEWGARRPRPGLDPAGASLEALSKWRDWLKGQARKLAALETLEKAILFQSHLLELSRCTVSAPGLLSLSPAPLFESGRLSVGGLELRPCLKLSPEASPRGGSPHLPLVVAEVEDPEGSWRVLAPLARGRSGRLAGGQAGVFRDRRGRERPARVLEVLAGPTPPRRAVPRSLAAAAWTLALALALIAAADLFAEPSAAAVLLALGGCALGAFRGIGSWRRRRRARDLRELFVQAGWGANLRILLDSRLAKRLTRGAL